jgi:hypothetical protein
MEAVDDSHVPERFKQFLMHEMRRENPNEFKRWSLQSEKFRDLSFVKIKELYKK